MKNQIRIGHLLALSCVFAAVACDNLASSDALQGDETRQPPSLHVTQTAVVPPEITMEDGAAVTFSVTLENVVGDDVEGELVDLHSNTAYGSFVAGDDPGQFTLTLPAAEIDRIRPLELNRDGLAGRSFLAVFGDAAGRLTEVAISAVFSCAEAQQLCGGVCTTVMFNPEHCGSCGNTCKTGTHYCAGDECRAARGWSRSIPVASLDSCAEHCTERGLGCAPECSVVTAEGVETRSMEVFSGITLMTSSSDDAGCTQEEWPDQATTVNCCCVDSGKP